MPDKIKVGIIGHTGRGNYGHGFDVCWREMEEIAIVGVADADERGRLAAQKRVRAPAAFADYRELLEKTKPDIVSIGTRHPDQHRDLLTELIELGLELRHEGFLGPRRDQHRHERLELRLVVRIDRLLALAIPLLPHLSQLIIAEHGLEAGVKVVLANGAHAGQDAFVRRGGVCITRFEGSGRRQADRYHQQDFLHTTFPCGCSLGCRTRCSGEPSPRAVARLDRKADC